MSPTLHRRDLASLALVAVAAAVSVLASPSLPAEMVTSFDLSGAPTDTLPTPVGLALAPGLAAAVAITFRVLPAIDPLGENIAAFQRYYDLAAVATVAFLAYVHVLLVTWNLGYEFSVVQAMVPTLAALYYMLGIVLEHAEQNWFVGVRTPWTLSNETVWDRTHERTAILFKLAGVIALLAIPFPSHVTALVVGPVALAALIATVYSFVVYRSVTAT